MPSTVRRHLLASLLILGASGLGTAVAHRDPPVPRLPEVGALTQGTGWQVDAASHPGGDGVVTRQWVVRDPAGTRALLFVQATARVQSVLHWTGELGFQGEGYEVGAHGERTLRPAHAPPLIVRRVVVEHLSNRLVLEYAVADRDGVTPGGTTSLLRRLWDILGGEQGPYYMVRVAMRAADAEESGASGERLLAAALRTLVVDARHGSPSPTGLWTSPTTHDPAQPAGEG